MDPLFQDLCNAPIPLDEALDSFDESPEIKNEAVTFSVGEPLIEVREENVLASTVIKADEKACLGRPVHFVAVSPSNFKSEENVTIVVEEEET